jgi:phosphoribosylformimino-5-aminoimidazole carboxamide ribotide isomerase
MIVYPAIDLRHGHVVRLMEGDPTRETVYGDDPAEVARRWVEAGAEWLHVINLDGALGGNNSLGALRSIAGAVDVPVQFGGGLRSEEAVRRAMEAGATRVILGTVAVEEPDLVERLLRQWGAERLAVALDTRGGQVVTHGWQTATGRTPVELGQELAALGMRHALYTDVARDGLLTGVNVEAVAHLARETSLSVIVAGGVRSLHDLCVLHAFGAPIAGAVVGKALYTGDIRLEDALRVAREGL